MEKIKYIFFILLLLTMTAQAEDITVVNVKSNIPLSDDEPVYRDYYLNAGEGSGLKKNLVVTVKRKLSVKDAAEKSVGELQTTVGQLRIIHVDKKASTAREYKLIPREEEAMLEQTGIMAGDEVDLQAAFTDSTPMKRKERQPSSQANAATVMPAAPANIEKNAPLEKPVEPGVPMMRTKPIEIPEI